MPPLQERRVYGGLLFSTSERLLFIFEIKTFLLMALVFNLNSNLSIQYPFVEVSKVKIFNANV